MKSISFINDSILDGIGRTPIVRLGRMFPHLNVFAKLEFLNPGGSIKDRPARFIIERGLREGYITQKTRLIGFSSGNMGIGLAMTAKVYGLPFICVVDPKIEETNLQLLRTYGAQVDMVSLPDDQGGYLKTCIQRVHQLRETLPYAYWANPYANPANWQAHYYGTANEVCKQMKRLDCLVLSVSTGGTILGMARRLRKEHPGLRVVAVDSVGSVIFGGPAGPHAIPGIGASRVPKLLSPKNREIIDEVIYVSDREAIDGCHRLLALEGIFAGGSSGAVIAAIGKLKFPSSSRILTLFPDRGERYLNTIYNETWVAGLP